MYACILLVLRVEAIMDDVIHVQVEVVVDEIAIATIRSLWFFLRGGDDPWVFHHGPPVEFRYSHGSCPGQLQRWREQRAASEARRG